MQDSLAADEPVHVLNDAPVHDTAFVLNAAHAIAFCDMLLVGAMRTVLPYYARSLGAKARGVSALEAFYGIGQVLGAVILGRWSDSRGRKAVLILSFAGSTVGYLLAATSVLLGAPALLLLSRLPVGLAKQTTTTCRAIVTDATPGAAERSQAQAALFARMAVGYAIGPAIGGWLLDRSTALACAWMPALLCAACYALLLPGLALRIPETSPPVRVDPAPPAPGGAPGAEGPPKLRSWRRRAVVVPVLLSVLPEAAVLCGLTGLPIYAQALGWEASRLGLFNSLWGLGAGAVSFGPLKWLCRNHADTSIAALGAAVLALGATALALAPLLLPSRPAVAPIALWLNLLTASPGIAILRTAPAAILSKAAPAEARGEALGLLDAAGSVCRILVPAACALAAEALGPSGPFALQAVAAWASAASLALVFAAGRPGGGRRKAE